jgi:aerobic carbon-monoxide dehydrogenase medium subunit
VHGLLWSTTGYSENASGSIVWGYCEPKTVNEALGELSHKEAVALAGGIDLGRAANLGAVTGGKLVWLGRLADLKGFSADEGKVAIGALSTHAELSSHEGLAKWFPSWRDVFGSIGNVRVRAWGTIGGNLAVSAAAYDPPVFLSVLDARIFVESESNARVCAMDALADAPVKRQEVISRIEIPLLGSGEYSAFAKSSVSVAAKVCIDGGRFVDTRLVCGNIGPAPICVDGLGVSLGRRIDDQVVVKDLGELVRASLNPLTDARNGEFKRSVAAALTRRTVMRCIQLARSRSSRK